MWFWILKGFFFLMKVKLKWFEGSPESITSADANRRFAVIHNPPMIVAVILIKT